MMKAILTIRKMHRWLTDSDDDQDSDDKSEEKDDSDDVIADSGSSKDESNEDDTRQLQKMSKASQLRSKCVPTVSLHHQ